MNQIVPDIRSRVGEPFAASVEDQDGRNCTTTTTQAFFDLLRAAKPDQQLVFQLDDAPLVAAGYHVRNSRRSPTTRWIAVESPISGKKP